jgi:hypothetical protein
MQPPELGARVCGLAEINGLGRRKGDPEEEEWNHGSGILSSANLWKNKQRGPGRAMDESNCKDQDRTVFGAEGYLGLGVLFLLFVVFHRLLEILDSFADPFPHLRQPLGPKQYEDDQGKNQKFRNA